MGRRTRQGRHAAIVPADWPLPSAIGTIRGAKSTGKTQAPGGASSGIHRVGSCAGR
ncbi:hypothetical protein [Deinococcus sp. Arct2-2]|uniref:hypothetical protein n=1 Tax=Deinococcus sp. Arct2-2 TaxID=2568653 RepID=UPI001454C253|nr:hypothetical protein [Deinococcus sp. Arct2-2]